jgi:hypothetical protein
VKSSAKSGDERASGGGIVSNSTDAIDGILMSGGDGGLELPKIGTGGGSGGGSSPCGEVTGVEGAVWKESVGDSGGESKGFSPGEGEIISGSAKAPSTCG